MSEFAAPISDQEFWSSVGYWILVAGLVGDIVVLAIPAHRGHLEKILSAIFTIVVIVGVAIEHNADAKIAVLVSQEESSTGLTIANLKKDTETARRDAADSKQKAEEEHIARLKLEVRIADRRLTDEQKRRIHDVLSAQPGYTVVVVSRLTDPEGEVFGDDFVGALKAANWNALWDRDWLRDTEGISIATVSGVKGPEVRLLDAALTAARIAHGFTVLGTDIHAIGGAGFQPGVTYLLVGHHKP